MWTDNEKTKQFIPLARAAASKFVKDRKNVLDSDEFQIALIKMARSFPSYDPTKGSMEVFLLGRAKHALIDNWRKNIKRSPNTTELVIDPQTENENLKENELDEYVHNLYQKVPDRDSWSVCRQVIFRHYWQKKPLREVSEDLNIPLGTVKSTLHRALERMRRIHQNEMNSS